MAAGENAQGYLTAGQLAAEVGVTIRTIQYYDQQKLLVPSAKGPNNQRLYTQGDKAALYRILTLKYLGMSLSDIRARQREFDDAAAFEKLVGGALGALEDDFRQLLKRLGVLRAMTADAAQGGSVDWTRIAHAIEEGQSDDYLWFGAVENAGSVPPTPTQNRERGRAVGAWHELIADALPLVARGVPADAPEAQAVAARYLDLQEQQGGSIEESFLLMENISPHRHGADGPDGSSFNAMRLKVSRYLADAADIARARRAGGQAAAGPAHANRPAADGSAAPPEPAAHGDRPHPNGE